MHQHLFTHIGEAHFYCKLSYLAQVSAPAEQKGPTTSKDYVILDDYTINMSDGLSGVFTTVNLSALTQSKSADLYDCNDLVQVLYDGANTSDNMVQSLYEFRANIVNPSDGISLSCCLVRLNIFSLFELPRPRTSSRRGRAPKRLRNSSDLNQHHKYLPPRRRQLTGPSVPGRIISLKIDRMLRSPPKSDVGNLPFLPVTPIRNSKVWYVTYRVCRNLFISMPGKTH